MFLSETKIPCSPGLWGWVDWVLACEPKGLQFNSQLEHMSGARSPVGGAEETTTHWCFSLFLPLSLKVNKYNVKKKNNNVISPISRTVWTKQTNEQNRTIGAEIRNKWQWPEGKGERKNGGKKGLVQARNICKGPMVMDNRVGIDWGSSGVGGEGETNKGKNWDNCNWWKFLKNNEKVFSYINHR